MSTPSLPDFPTRKSLETKVTRYREGALAHARGEHDDVSAKRFCVRCANRTK